MGSFLLFSLKAKRSEALSDRRGGPSGCMEGTGISGELARSARSPGPSGLKDCVQPRGSGALIHKGDQHSAFVASFPFKGGRVSFSGVSESVSHKDSFAPSWLSAPPARVEVMGP